MEKDFSLHDNAVMILGTHVGLQNIISNICNAMRSRFHYRTLQLQFTP